MLQWTFTGSRSTEELLTIQIPSKLQETLNHKHPPRISSIVALPGRGNAPSFSCWLCKWSHSVFICVLQLSLNQGWVRSLCVEHWGLKGHQVFETSPETQMLCSVSDLMSTCERHLATVTKTKSDVSVDESRSKVGCGCEQEKDNVSR